MADQLKQFNDFQTEFSAWAFKTFTQQPVEAKIRHLKKEADEIIEDPADIEEWADVFLLFSNAAKLQGFALTDILEAARKKWLNDLVHRQWQPPDEDGCVHHVKPEGVRWCRDCRFFCIDLEDAYCGHRLSLSPSSLGCGVNAMRREGGLCGPDARLFKPKLGKRS